MSGKLRLIHRNVLDADAVLVTADVLDPIDQQKRITVRQEAQNFLDVGSAERLFGHSVSPSGLPRASRRKIATLFMKSRNG